MTRVVESAFLPYLPEVVFRTACDPQEQLRWDRASLRRVERLSPGTMAFAGDWDEIRIAGGLAILNGVAVLAASLASLGEFDSPRAPSYLVAVAVLTVGMIFFFWRQERRGPSAAHHPQRGTRLRSVDDEGGQVE